MNHPTLRFAPIGVAGAPRDRSLGRAFLHWVRTLYARAAAARRALRVRRETREIYRVLHGLDDATLRDLGFHRCEIWSVAAESTGEADATRMRTILRPRTPR